MEVILLQLNNAFPPHCDGPAQSNGAGSRIISTAITAAGIPPDAGRKRKIVVLCNNTIDTAISGVIVLLPPYTTSRGEQDASNGPYTTVGLSTSYQPQAWHMHQPVP
jgi:hypothetical protein